MSLTKKSVLTLVIFVLCTTFVIAGGTKESSQPPQKAESIPATILTVAKPTPAKMQVRLSTTTSTDQSGLLGYLLPMFESKTGYRVQVIAVGSGAAIKLGEDGNVDIVLAHAPDLEKKFVVGGAGINRFPLMYNDFIILGPKADPAQVKKAKTPEEAFAALQKNAQAAFISRGDKSGTDIKEKELWSSLGLKPSGSWYKEIGQGMAQCIIMAGDLEGYTLADRATWLATKDKSKLEIAFSGGNILKNPYAIIQVNPEKHPSVNSEGAKALSDWILSKEGKSAITAYKIDGNQCFFLFN